LFRFRKSRNFGLRFAHLSVTIGTANAISPEYGWNYESVQEQYGCCEDE